MSRYELRFRQVHLDFHTSPAIPGIGRAFDKKLWQERLRTAHVDSITCFSNCHHGYSYHPTKVGEMHPGLDFDLLRAQMDACHEIGVRVPVYITAGVNNRVAELEPGWRELNFEGRYVGWQPSPVLPGFKSLCFNTPYLDYLCEYIAEVAKRFPDADGMFFDIISQNQCCCPWCMRSMKKAGFDPEREEDRKAFSDQVLANYMKRSVEAARSVRSDMPVLHNAGHYLGPGYGHLAQYFSHLELESLPTGGWGYDHYPLMAAFCRTQEKDFLGMTGKFHTTWGEFGGFKTANALRYECAAMLANGSKCSIGDQLHPSGMLDESTCRLIGSAYAEVEKKEPWCRGAVTAAETAIVSNVGFQGWTPENETPEIGVSRILLESHIPFDRLDPRGDFAPYKVLILADNLRPDAALRKRLEAFTAAGGKVILSGTSFLKKEEDSPAFDLPVESSCKVNMRIPDYIQAAPEFVPEGISTPFVMYRPPVEMKCTGGRSLGRIFEPYFTRTYEHFCSHQHTPFKPEPSSFDAGVLTEQFLCFAHPVFTLYALYGTEILKEFIVKAIRALLKEELQVVTDLPSQGRVFLQEQKGENRCILHALYATPSLRGMQSEAFMPGMRPTRPVEVIEDLPVLCDVSFEVKVPRPVKSVTLAPEGGDLPFEYAEGRVRFKLPKLQCHQMIVLNF